MDPSTTMEPATDPTPPPAPWPGAPTPTPDDPTADGYYCGTRRSPGQVAQAVESGDPNPWPWCRNRAGKGTDHPGIGSCRNHLGTTRDRRVNARLRMAELVGPALATLARTLTDDTVPPSVRLRAAQDVLDRAGYPRRVEIDVDEAREDLYGRLLSLQASDEVAS